MSSVQTPQRTERVGRARALLLLVLLCSVQFIDAFDVSSMGPALPEIHGTWACPRTPCSGW